MKVTDAQNELWLRLRGMRLQMIGQIAHLEEQKKELFQHGSQQSSARMQTIFARRIRDLDQQAAGIDRSLQLVHILSLLLGQLIYAQENADRQSVGLLADLDWDKLLGSVDQASAIQQATLEQLDSVLDVLERRLPATPKQFTSRTKQPQPATYRVTHVPDGDGLELEDGTRVRYIGIDAPEISGWDGQPEPYAEDAKELNAQLVLGKRVRLVRDTSEADRYGRLLRYVYVGSIFVNAEVVRTGLARAFDLWPDNKHAEEFLSLEEQAHRVKLGMWRDV